MSEQTEEQTEDQAFESKLLTENTELMQTVVALCEYDGRCSKCYRYMSVTDKANCGGCEEYYCECNCEKLTVEQIINGEHQ